MLRSQERNIITKALLVTTWPQTAIIIGDYEPVWIEFFDNSILCFYNS